MKKMLMVFVCAVMAFAFYGCKEETTQEKLQSGANDAVEKADDAASDAADKLNDAMK